jgi:hypothetical protein
VELQSRGSRNSIGFKGYFKEPRELPMAGNDKSGKPPLRPRLEFGALSSTAVNAPGAYRALAIIPGPGACAVAKRFANHRFLLGEAPSPPLAGCDMQGTCTCKFQKFADRRSDFRRGSDEGIPDFGLVVVERRKTTRRAKIRGNGKK